MKEKNAAAQRVTIIKNEFEVGFKFLEEHLRSVTFFGSSKIGEDSLYYHHARTLAYRIVKELNYAVLTGGGPGIMEAANRGALEAGGPSLGLTIKMPEKQPTNKYLTEQVDFYYFFTRKVCLSFAAEAYIFYPGGFGTLDEFFEILTLVQTGRVSRLPIILVGGDYWRHFDRLIRQVLLEKFRAVETDDPNLYLISDDLHVIMEAIKKSPVRETLKCCGSDLKNQ